MSQPFYRAFEDRHRGSRELIKSRQQIYLPFIQPLKTLYSECSVLDVGCGRGEWLELLLENGFQAQGVDLDQGMLASCKELNLPAKHGEALDTLVNMPSESLAVISGFHIAEHIPFSDLQQLVAEALRALKPAGILILETPNTENLVVGTTNFYIDPSHLRPIPHQLLSFLTEHAGFSRCKLLRLHEAPELTNKLEIDLIDVLAGISPDYSVVAQKCAAPELMSLFRETFDASYGLTLDNLANRYDSKISKQLTSLSNQFIALEDRARTTTLTLEKIITLQDELLEAERRAQEKLDEANYWHNCLLSVHQSSSWKITAPLRATKRIATGDFSPISRIICAIIHPILRREKSRLWLASKLKRHPRLQRFFCRLAPSIGSMLDDHYLDSQTPPAIDLKNFTPNARQIYMALKSEIEKRKMKDN